MQNCPHCGAENPPGASFCSLCLARLADAESGPSVPGRSPTEPEPAASAPQPSSPARYVSPGDFHAVTREVHEAGRGPVETNVHVFLDSPASGDDAVAAAVLPGRTRKRSTGDSALLVLKHSLLVFMLLLVASFIVGLFLVRAIFSGSESGYYLGLGIQFSAEALLIIWGGYRISMEAMERDRGWLYGIACVAGIVFFWQPLLAFILTLFLTGKPLLPQTFSLVGILVVVFLLFPLGALGGWLAEKRYLG